MSPSDPDAVQVELQEWLCAKLATQLNVPDGKVDPAQPMSVYGLDSLKTVALLAEVEDHVGFEIDPDALWDYPTVEAFTRFLAEQVTTRPKAGTAHASPIHP